MSSESLEHLPQTGPARLIAEVVEVDDAHTVCLARVPARSPFRSCGPTADSVPASLAIEMAAQAAAVAEPPPPGRDAASSPSPRLLAGTRDVTLHGAALRADATFRVHTTRTTLAPPLRVYRFEVFDGESLVAEGELSTFYDAGPQGFLPEPSPRTLEGL